MTPDLFPRRAFLLSGLAFGAGAALGSAAMADEPIPGPLPGEIVFEVHRNGAMLGRHQVKLSRDSSDLVADIQVDMLLELGPVPLFRYSHRAQERWSGGRFDSLKSQSVTNGHRQAVSASRTAAGVMIAPADGAPYLADASALPLTHWNRRVMSAPLFNPQDGKLMRERASALGPDTVELADGRMIRADRYLLTGETQIDDWYDGQGAWTALRGKLKDGSTVTYRRIEA